MNYLEDLKECRKLFEMYHGAMSYGTKRNKNHDEYMRLYELTNEKNNLRYRLNDMNNMNTIENDSKLCRLHLNNYLDHIYYTNEHLSKEYFDSKKKGVKEEMKTIKKEMKGLKN